MDAAVLPVEFHTVEGSHDVKAVYKGMHIEMSGVTLIQENDYYNDDAGMWGDRQRGSVQRTVAGLRFWS